MQRDVYGFDTERGIEIFFVALRRILECRKSSLELITVDLTRDSPLATRIVDEQSVVNLLLDPEMM